MARTSALYRCGVLFPRRVRTEGREGFANLLVPTERRRVVPLRGGVANASSKRVGRVPDIKP
jgi:hypothetical protein